MTFAELTALANDIEACARQVREKAKLAALSEDILAAKLAASRDATPVTVEASDV